MLRVRAHTPIRPSEDPRKVEKALKTIFPGATITTTETDASVETDSLKGFRDQVWKQRILDATRRILLGSLRSGEGNRSRFTLNKQAAFAGSISFAVAHAPLGDIEIEVEGDHLEALFKDIAPPTLNGRPVTEEQYEHHLEKKRKSKVHVRGPPEKFGEEVPLLTKPIVSDEEE